MWKYYVTEDNVFWDKNTTDKPSRDYLENVMKWEPLDINLNLREMGTTQVMLNRDTYSLIKAFNDENNTTLYFMLIKCLKYAENGYLLEYELDTWCSYTLPITEMDINVLCERHQDYDDENYLKFDDELMNIELTFNNYQYLKNEFNKQVDAKYTSYTRGDSKIEIINDDIVNAVYCLVIADTYSTTNINNYYTFIPILSLAESPRITSKGTGREIWDGQRLKNVDISSMRQFFWGYNSPKISTGEDPNRFKATIDYYYKMLAKGYSAQVSLITCVYYNNKPWFYEYKLDDYLAKYKLEDIYIYTLIANTNSKLYYEIHHGKDAYDTKTVFKLPPIKPDKDNYSLIRFDFYKTVPLNGAALANNWLKVNELSKQVSNKNMLGIYQIPNVLNFSKIWDVQNINNEKFLTLNIKQNSSIIDDFKFNLNRTIDTNYRFNNPNIQFKNILKKFEYNYLNNPLDVSKMLNQNNEIVLADNVLFTNTFILKKNNPLIPLDNQVLELPAQQPFFIDTYKDFVNANMNTVNVGYAVQKQQSIFSGINGVLSGITSGVIGSALSGNPLGIVSGAASGINSIASSVMGVQNYEKQIKAKYADADFSMGNKLLFSSTKDTLFNEILTSENDNFDVLHYKELTEDSIIQLNNTLLLNGVYNPKYFKLNALPETTKHLGFKYAKLNSTNFNQIFSKYINSSMRKKEIILRELQEFRIWDKIPSIE